MEAADITAFPAIQIKKHCSNVNGRANVLAKPNVGPTAEVPQSSKGSGPVTSANGFFWYFFPGLTCV